MDPTQFTLLIDTVFNYLESKVKPNGVLHKALVLIQQYLDANAATIAPTLPSSATDRQAFDAAMAWLESKSPWYLVGEEELVQVAVDAYLTQH